MGRDREPSLYVKDVSDFVENSIFRIKLLSYLPSYIPRTYELKDSKWILVVYFQDFRCSKLSELNKNIKEGVNFIYFYMRVNFMLSVTCSTKGLLILNNSSFQFFIELHEHKALYPSPIKRAYSFSG